VQGVYSGTIQGGSFLSAMLCTVLYGWQPVAPFVLCAVVVAVTVALGGLFMARTDRSAVEAVAVREA
jgi:hypothetical protein